MIELLFKIFNQSKDIFIFFLIKMKEKNET